MKQIVKVVILLSTLIGQTISSQQLRNKCGYDQNYETQIIQQDGQNWGYGYDSLLIDLERWSESPFVVIDSLGASVQNRGIWELTIADTSDPDSSLQRIYIHARTHPGEEESFWVTNEVINLLLSDSPFAEFVRSNFIFHIIPMFNPDGVELGYPRENANGVDIESGWDDSPMEPEVLVLKNRFSELMELDNPIRVALNMHSAYACTRYFVYHDAVGTSLSYTGLEQQFISGIRFYYLYGIEPWYYYISWTSGTPDQYPESWWWMNYAENVMALTYEDMNCEQAGSYDSTAYAIVRGITDYLGLNYAGIGNHENISPTDFSLSRNYPNPFNPITTLRYELPENSLVNITIYDMLGRKVKTLVNQRQDAGIKSVIWDATDNHEEPVSAGVYLYSISAGNFTETGKMIFLK